MPGSRQDLRQQLSAVAFAQAGYFTAAQALSIGYSYQAQKYHADHGNWVRVQRRSSGYPGGQARPPTRMPAGRSGLEARESSPTSRRCPSMTCPTSTRPACT